MGAYKSTGKEPVSGAWSAHVLHSVAQVPVYCPYINTPKAAKGHQQKRRERAASPLLRVNSRSHVSGLQNTGPGLGSPQPPKAGKRFEKRSGVFRKRSGFLQTKGQNGEISQTPASFKKLRNFQNFLLRYFPNSKNVKFLNPSLPPSLLEAGGECCPHSARCFALGVVVHLGDCAVDFLD